MSTNKDIRPLLVTTEHITNDTLTDYNDNKKRMLKIIFIIVIVIIIGCIILIIAYVANIWPFQSTETSKQGIYGKYPVWGGNVKNQQISINSIITKENIGNIQQLCIYNGSQYDTAVRGYITVDNKNNGYFGTSGFVRSINLNNCSINWNKNVSDLLNYSGPNYYELKTATGLFQTKSSHGLLFGTGMEQSDPQNGCYAIAVNIEDGTFLWKTILAKGKDSTVCQSHGFMIDDQFAYGGISSYSHDFYPDVNNSMFVGRMSKININNGELIKQFYSLPQYNSSADYDTNGFYSGASIWPIGAIIDEYIVFGTGQLYNYPKKVEQCLLGNASSIPIENVFEYNLCEQDMREKYLNWRCLEKNIYPDSLIILNKNTFKLEAAIPFAGVDAWGWYCFSWPYQYNQTIPNKCPKVLGPDADATAIATYHDKNNGKAYVAVGQKSGQFYVIEIPSGEVKIMKKVGPWSYFGGSSPFSLAIDDENMIAVYTMMKAIYYGPVYIGYRYKMGDGTIVCEAATLHFIDLYTGYTRWQWINPYAKMNNLCNQSIYDEYVDMTINGTCERAFDGSDMLQPNLTISKVVIPPIDNEIIPLNSMNRVGIKGAVTISNNMVFIPTMTGDIFIHDILTGDYIDRLHCPNYKINATHWDRAPIESGITIYDDRIVFNCRNQIVSMKL